LERIKKAADENGTDPRIRVSYSFETALRVRGERWVLTERQARDGSAIFRRFDELFPAKKLGSELNEPEQIHRDRERHQRVDLFTVFLDTFLRTLDGLPEEVEGKQLLGTLGFALRLRVVVPDYEVDGSFWRRNHYEGSSLFDRDLVFLAFEGWSPDRLPAPLADALWPTRSSFGSLSPRKAPRIQRMVAPYGSFLESGTCRCRQS
jgi:hypothetical protein